MSFSYDTSLSSNADKVRLYLGDTASATALYSDEEIAAVLTDEPDPYLAAAVLADGAAGKYSRLQDMNLDGFSVRYGARAQAFRDLAARLRLQATTAAGGLGSPSISGISIADMDSVRDDTDRVPSRAETGSMDYPGTDPGQTDVDGD